jgi:hypothetical protein
VEVQVPSWESLSNCVESDTQESGGASTYKGKRKALSVLIFNQIVTVGFPAVVYTQSVQQGCRYTQTRTVRATTVLCPLKTVLVRLPLSILLSHGTVPY